jgi:hypothetical protein
MTGVGRMMGDQKAERSGSFDSAGAEARQRWKSVGMNRRT